MGISFACHHNVLCGKGQAALLSGWCRVPRVYPGNLVAVDAASQVKINPQDVVVCLETLAIHCIVHLNGDTSYVSFKLQNIKCTSGQP